MSRFISHKDDVIEALHEQRTTALIRIGLEMEKNAKGYAPVDTGRLRNSIGNYADDDTVYVGTNVEYAPYQEFGTSRQGGKAFLAPAVENHIQDYRRIIEEELKR